MGTYATIAAQTAEGKILWVEVSNDGYISHTGHILLAYYPTRSAAFCLIENGDMRQLKSDIRAIEFNYDMDEPHRFGSVDTVDEYIAMQRNDFMHNYYLDLSGVWNYFSYDAQVKPLMSVVEPKQPELTKIDLTRTRLHFCRDLITQAAASVWYELQQIWKLWVK